MEVLVGVDVTNAAATRQARFTNTHVYPCERRTEVWRTLTFLAGVPAAFSELTERRSAAAFDAFVRVARRPHRSQPGLSSRRRALVISVGVGRLLRSPAPRPVCGRYSDMCCRQYTASGRAVQHSVRVCVLVVPRAGVFPSGGGRLAALRVLAARWRPADRAARAPGLPAGCR